MCWGCGKPYKTKRKSPPGQKKAGWGTQLKSFFLTYAGWATRRALLVSVHFQQEAVGNAVHVEPVSRDCTLWVKGGGNKAADGARHVELAESSVGSSPEPVEPVHDSRDRSSRVDRGGIRV